MLNETERYTEMVYKDWQEGIPNIYDYIGPETESDYDEDGNPQGSRAEVIYLHMSAQEDGSFYWELGECFQGGKALASGFGTIEEVTEKAGFTYKKLGLNLEGLDEISK